MIARFTLVTARVALTGWLVLVAFVAIGSLVASPGPFVLFAFVIGGSPLWLFVRRYQWAHFIWVAVVAAALPVWLLASYGADEGGVSGVHDTLLLALSLTTLAYVLAWIGYALGRIVWPYPDVIGVGKSTES